tara:strand:+ start:15058 stop:16068 length:1011 start_codon:yes stop_codon:yes gene_type:complete
MSHLRLLTVDELPALSEDPVAFLNQLNGPVVITVPGASSAGCRAVVTLLHGNEPSGMKAMLRYLRSGQKPAVTLHLFIISVHTALHPPVFTHRQIPGERDMNRTFRPPFDDDLGELASQILAHLVHLAPEVVVDVHNTSGDGPAFAVSPALSEAHIALTRLFTHRLVVTDLQLGSLMEISSTDCPAITIECGGATGSVADEVAYAGLCRLAAAENLFSWQDMSSLDLYHHPVRLELAAECSIVYDTALDADVDLCLPPDIDHFNFGVVDPGVCLGRVRSASCLRIKSAAGYQAIDEYFHVLPDGSLHPRVPLKLFMVTTNAAIARSDCLLYAVRQG